MTKGAVVVLEDSLERADWLRKALCDYEVVVLDTVAPFVAAVAEHRAALKLVIFDHDLGRTRAPVSPYDSSSAMLLSYDAEGKSGHDAAREVEPFDAPALVWSHNPSGRMSIGETLLRSDKSKHVQVAPFEASASYAALLGRLLAKR